ncbi:ABC transporter ATP-binding protein [Inediibacterium massiliense]|uniref:ABC transporter ATP-binding protein n=1 Tax=Inediibacterium massiliense TaxID=1658111 RepID=UPI0006B57DFF|nr:ABC transporter ATP-binding protein [Inediibacterium massiliense]
MNINLENLYKSYKNLSIYENFHMSIPKKKTTCILGPSGCGKTTLLNILSKVIPFDKGKIIGLDDLSISYLFQEPRLLPWKSVQKNIEFVLKKVYKKEEREKIAKEYIKKVGLEGFENYYPKDLSTGMKHRVSMARAFAYPSDLLLMDEPFTGLDIKTKNEMMKIFLHLVHTDIKTIVFVTHSIEDAVLLGDVVYIFSDSPVKIKKTFFIDIKKEERNLDHMRKNIDHIKYILKKA